MANQCYATPNSPRWHTGFRRLGGARPRSLRLIVACHGTDNVSFFPWRFRRGKEMTARSARASPTLSRPGFETRASPRRTSWACGSCGRHGVGVVVSTLPKPQNLVREKPLSPANPVTPGMFGYSILRMQHSREFFRALMAELPLFRRAARGF